MNSNLYLYPFTEEELSKFNLLSIEECEVLIQWLQNRVHLLQNVPILEKPVRELNLSTRATNALLNQHLNVVKDVIDYGFENIFLLRGAGNKTTMEIKKAIMGLGI